MAHNHAARKGEDSFSGASRFDVEDLVVNLLFDKQSESRGLGDSMVILKNSPALK
jgi:hypothetical protein